MKFNGALVKTNEDTVIGVAVVEHNFLELPNEERVQRMKQYKAGFGPQIPMVLLIASHKGSKERYWGRPDLVDQLTEIPLNMMSFKTQIAPDTVE